MNSQVGPAIGASFVALLALVAIIVVAFMFRRCCGDEGRDGSMGKKGTLAIVDRYEDSKHSSDYDNVYEDDLSRNWYMSTRLATQPNSYPLANT